MEQDEILSKHREEAYNVGGQKQIDRLAKQGKKPMRDLISMLIDPGTEYFEIGLDTGYDIGKKRVTAERSTSRKSVAIYPEVV